MQEQKIFVVDPRTVTTGNFTRMNMLRQKNAQRVADELRISVQEAEGQINSVLNPWYRQEWQDIGMRVSKYVPPSAIPSWMGGFGGSVIQEKAGEVVQNKVNGADQK